jgi:anti-anti-sigma regulatory factor
VATPEIEEIADDTAVITLETTHVWSGDEIDAMFASLTAAGRRRIVVDASAAPMVNSKVLDALVRCAADLDPRDGAGIALVTRLDYVKQMLTVSTNGGIVFLADTREDALDALPRRR